MRYLRPILALLLLVLLPTLFLWKLTLAGRILVGLDPFNFFYPYHDGVAAALAAGRLAEWNAMLFGGVPFLADSQAQVLYPFGWPFLLVSAPKALTYGIALHLGIAALGTYCWARWGLGMSAWGAWLAGALFALSGYLGAQIEHVNQVQAAAWLPWLLLGYQWGRGLPEHGDKHEDKASENNDKVILDYKLRTRGVLLGSFALTMSLLAGHAQTTFISLMMLGFWMLRCAIRDDERTRRYVLKVQRSGISRTVVTAAWRNFLNVNLVPLLAIVLIAALLSAIQLVPTQRLSLLSQREGGLPFLEAVSFSFDPRIIPRAMLPTFGQDIHLLSEYVAWSGFIGLTLALIGAIAPVYKRAMRRPSASSGTGGEGAKRQKLVPHLSPRRKEGSGDSRPLTYPAKSGALSPSYLPSEVGHPLDLSTRPSRDFGLLASGLGLFLALGGYNPLYWLLWRVVPGFDLFRAPARWLLLWALGVAILAGVGLEQLRRREQGLGEREAEQGLGEREAKQGLGEKGGVQGKFLFILALPATLKFLFILALLLLLFFVLFGSWPQPPLSVLPWWLGAITLAMIAVGSRWIWPKSFVIPHSAFVIALVLLELWAATWGLDHQQATAPEAYGGLRPVPAHLITKQPDIGAARVLSLSDLTWDPGDLGNLQARHADLLAEKPIYDLVVVTKLKEVIAPNQPMRWNLQSADGYGGGLLPSSRWVEFQKHLPLAEVVPDGRLREQLTRIPRPALLDVMGVEWIVADKVFDWWSQNIYHDLGAPITLAAGDTIGGWSILGDDKRASGQGNAGAIRRDAVSKYGLSQITALSLMVIGDWPAQPGYLSLGEQTIDLAQAGEQGTRETPHGLQRHLLLTLESTVDLNTVDQIAITATNDWTLGALSLVDSTLPSFQPLPANPNLRMTFSGDVKVYERTNPPGRAVIVPQAIPVETIAAAANFVADATFNAQDSVIIEQENANNPLPSGGTGSVRWLRDEPGNMLLEVSVPEGGWLVVADAPFPGWQATVDGTRVEWHAANVINRALFLPPGEHTVSWRYHTPGLQIGIIGTLLGVLALMGWVWNARRE